MNVTTRSMDSLITAHRQLEGGGFVVRQPFPTAELAYIDPFLLIDEMGPADYAPGEAIDTRIPITFQDWTLKPGADVRVDLPAGEQAMVYVFDGSLRIGDDQQIVDDGQLARLGDGDSVRLRHGNTGTARALLLAGKPIQEPVARYGPFVMNNEAELQQAFADYRSGRMGEITRQATIG